jgi:hypothetical protein
MAYKTREQLISELRTLGYTNVKVRGGTASLESAPVGNLYYAYINITGRIEKKKYNQVKP